MRIAVAGAGGLIGSGAVTVGEAAGHEVVRLSRHDGVDLTDPDAGDLVDRLRDVDVVVDVTRPASRSVPRASSSRPSRPTSVAPRRRPA